MDKRRSGSKGLTLSFNVSLSSQKPQGLENQMTFVVLTLYTVINVFWGSILSFYQHKNPKSSQISRI